MPPKKDNKKKGKGAAEGPIVVDPADYQRDNVELPVLGGVSEIQPATAGSIFHCENTFEEWQIEDENWNDVSDADRAFEPKYPDNIQVEKYQRIKDYLGLAAEESDKPAKGAKKGAVVTLEDIVADDKGTPLPRVFLPVTEGSTEVSERKMPRGFRQVDGKDIDALICSAYRIVERFSPTLANDAPFLWTAIYPQTNTVPVYNPTGKYAVKLFVAGKWRKVYVIDAFPVNESGVSVASSANNLELWPTILAKAIYTVYTALGFSFTISEYGAPCSKTTSFNLSSFLSFAVHSLTGWLPASPWSLALTLHQDCARFKSLLEEVTFGGAAVLSPSGIPSQEPILLKSQEEESFNGLQTKKQVKDLLKIKEAERKFLIQDILKREEQINIISTQLAQPFKEVYTISISHRSGISVYPILGICYDEDSSDIRFLTKWVVGEAIQNQSPVDESNPQPLEPLPLSTQMSYEFITLKEIIQDCSVHICGLDTKQRVPHTSEIAWHYETQSEDSDAKKKPKDKKDKKVASTGPPLGTPLPGTDPGVFNPTFLTVDPANYALTNTHLSLSLFIQADILLISDTVQREEAVVVLQEVRDDGDEPLVMRVQLCAAAALPYARTTFHIPVDRLPQKPAIFWLRVFTNTSIYISAHCGASITIGDAATIWENNGGKAMAFDGVATPIHAHNEQVIFRCPLNSEAEEDNTALFFVHTTNKAVQKTLSLVELRNSGAVVLPVIQGHLTYIPAASTVTIVGRCYCETNVPEFKWKILALSRHTLQQPAAPVNNATQNIIYEGKYIANNHLLIFRDVISADIDSFPLALRLRVDFKESDDTSTDVPFDINEDICFIVRTYRKSDRMLIQEYTARGLLQIYNLSGSDFFEGAEVPADKGKKEDKKAKKGDKVEPQAEFIVECLLDESAMVIPDAWRSRFPYQFYNGSVNEGESPPVSYFSWRLSCLAGRVTKMYHDTYELERRAEMKNKWESDDEGRRQRAAAAKQYATLMQTPVLERDDAFYQDRVASLLTALDKEEDAAAKDAEANYSSIPQYKEHVEEPSSEPTVLDEMVLEKERAKMNQDKEDADVLAEQALASFGAYFDMLKSTVLARVESIREESKTQLDISLASWTLRDEYRANIEKKNESLSYLLQRASDAIETVIANEEAADPSKKTNKKAPAKKK